MFHSTPGSLMNDQQKQDSALRDQTVRAALGQHWAASDANDFETEHLIYHGSFRHELRALILAWRRIGERENRSGEQQRVKEVVDPHDFDFGARIG